MLSENISLVFYQEMKQEWSREEYVDCCNRNEKRYDLLEVGDLEIKRK
jgi:hypothetical protein